jgi:hypothetical protein
MGFGDYSQQVLQSTGSFSGYRPLRQLGHGYLSATEHFKQPLCGNEEGWGPMSPFRYDFTPCFIDVWVSSVAVFGLVCGAFALWYVLRKPIKQEVPKDWHFWTKQVSFYNQFRTNRMVGAPLLTHLCFFRHYSSSLSPISSFSSLSRSLTSLTSGTETFEC